MNGYVFACGGIQKTSKLSPIGASTIIKKIMNGSQVPYHLPSHLNLYKEFFLNALM